MIQLPIQRKQNLEAYIHSNFKVQSIDYRWSSQDLVSMDVGMHWVGDRLKGLQNWSVSDVKAGRGELITYKGDKVAVYKDESGNVNAVSAVCLSSSWVYCQLE
ncbi:MAG: hypothetical protein ACFB02_19010 [Mastigocoleus sp.]